MEESYLRSTLLNIQDRLSNNDRQRLHFLLCDHLPRRIVDDTSHQGTLLCVESLLDQNKINERNLTFLTNALEAIGRLDLVRLLKGYLPLFFVLNSLSFLSVRFSVSKTKSIDQETLLVHVIVIHRTYGRSR